MDKIVRIIRDRLADDYITIEKILKELEKEEIGMAEVILLEWKEQLKKEIEKAE